MGYHVEQICQRYDSSRKKLHTQCLVRFKGHLAHPEVFSELKVSYGIFYTNLIFSELKVSYGIFYTNFNLCLYDIKCGGSVVINFF